MSFTTLPNTSTEGESIPFDPQVSLLNANKQAVIERPSLCRL